MLTGFSEPEDLTGERELLKLSGRRHGFSSWLMREELAEESGIAVLQF